jgi:LemA protein
MQYVIVGILLGIIILTAGWLIYFYNKAANKKTQVDESWAQLVIQYRKKSELLNQYIEIVFDYVVINQEILFKVIRSGSYFSQTPREYIRFSREQNELLEKLAALSGLHPKIDMKPGIAELRFQLDELDKKIEKYRQLYNDKVSLYNNFIGLSPHNVMAMLLDIKRMPYFVPDDSDLSTM